MKVEGFSAHVSWLHADSDYKFSLEFEVSTHMFCDYTVM